MGADKRWTGSQPATFKELGVRPHIPSSDRGVAAPAGVDPAALKVLVPAFQKAATCPRPGGDEEGRLCLGNYDPRAGQAGLCGAQRAAARSLAVAGQAQEVVAPDGNKNGPLRGPVIFWLGISGPGELDGPAQTGAQDFRH